VSCGNWSVGHGIGTYEGKTAQGIGQTAATYFKPAGRKHISIWRSFAQSLFHQRQEIQSPPPSFSGSGLFGYLSRRRKSFESFPVGIRIIGGMTAQTILEQTLYPFSSR
jgi:hypothetical protein